MLEVIDIEGFMSFKKTRISLERVNILIGANGSGKSNFVRLFNFLRQMTTKDFRAYVGNMGGTNRFFHNGRKNTKTINIAMGFEAKEPDLRNFYECTLTPTPDSNIFTILDRGGFWDKNTPYLGPKWKLITDGGEWSNRDSMLQIGINRYVRNYMRSYRVYHFHDTSFTADMKMSRNVSDNDFYREDASNLAPFLYRLKNKDENSYQNIVESIRLVAPFFEDFDLKPEKLDSNRIKLEWKEKGTDTYRDGYSLSDGTLRFICLAVLFLQPEPPSTIIIDEPELGLHPFAISQLAALIRSTESQVILATQSVTLLDEFYPDDIIVVERRDQEGAELKRLEKEELKTWAEEYSLGEMWCKNLLGGRP